MFVCFGELVLLSEKNKFKIQNSKQVLVDGNHLEIFSGITQNVRIRVWNFEICLWNFSLLIILQIFQPGFTFHKLPCSASANFSVLVQQC
jgi:hypothetical protein